MNIVYFSSILALSDELYNKFYKITKRKSKIDKLLKIDDKKRSLLAGILLDFALKERGIFSYELYYNDFGKPFLAGIPLFFSLSHSGDFVLCALSDKCVGADIELVKGDNTDIARHFFSKDEFSKITSNDDFFELWCKKESYLKALGTGLSAGLDTQLNDEILINKQKYYIQQLQIHKAYKAALCSAYKAYELRKISLDDLDF